MRALLIFSAYVASVLTATIVAFGGTILGGDLLRGYSVQSFSENMQWLVVFGVVTAVVAFVPSLIAILIAEAYGVRTLAAHLIVGLGIGALTLAFAHLRAPILFDGPGEITNILRGLWLVGGLSGALMYWLIAGRRTMTRGR